MVLDLKTEIRFLNESIRERLTTFESRLSCLHHEIQTFQHALLSMKENSNKLGESQTHHTDTQLISYKFSSKKSAGETMNLTAHLQRDPIPGRMRAWTTKK